MEIIRSHPSAAFASLAALVITPLAVRDYLTYLSYGPGGLPYNVGGWFVTNLLRLVSREQLSVRPYHDAALYLHGQSGHLPEDFPRRRGLRPIVGPHPIPQRQLSQLPDGLMRQELVTSFTAFAKSLQIKGIVEVKQSLLERHHDALFAPAMLQSQWHPVAQQTRGEIAHIHAGKDGSVHVVLHPRDCEVVIEKGWGQRHAFSGVGVMKMIAGFELPINYVLVYAPRDRGEVEVVMRIVETAVKFMTESQDSMD